jgi:hypothetical protein
MGNDEIFMMVADIYLFFKETKKAIPAQCSQG